MASFEFKAHRVTALPSTLEAYSVYFVANASKPEYVEIYVSSSDGSTAKRVINENDVKVLISEEVTGLNEIYVYDTIADRDAAGISTTQFAYVVNASDDNSVESGGATYIYNKTTDAWVKTSESESMDLVFNWENIIGKPSSTPAAIDDAVANSHTHTNKTNLDKIGEDAEGYLTYNGETIAGSTQWITTNW